MSNYLLKNRAPGLTAALALAKSQKMFRPELAATFTGAAGQHLRVESISEFSLIHGQPLVVGGWMKCTGTPPTATYQRLLYKRNPASAATSHYDLGALNLGSQHVRTQFSRKTLATGVTASAVTILQNPPPPEVWNFYMASYFPNEAGEDTYGLTANGLTTYYSLGATWQFPSAPANDPLLIGGSAAAATTGKICSVFVMRPNAATFNSSVKDAIFNELYSNGYGRSYRSLSDKDMSDFGLVSWWNLDTIENGVFKDSHGSNHALIVGNVLVS